MTHPDRTAPLSAPELAIAGRAPPREPPREGSAWMCWDDERVPRGLKWRKEAARWKPGPELRRTG